MKWPRRFVEFFYAKLRADPFAAIIAFATIAYVIVSSYQWTEIRDAKEVAQRAWIIVSRHVVEMEMGKPLRFTAAIENAGNSPAVLVESVSAARLIRPPDRLEYDDFSNAKEPEKSTKNILGPKQSIESSVTGPTVVPVLLDALRAQTDFLYRYGRIKYKDAFGKLRTTRYCERYYSEFNRFMACQEPGSNYFD